MRCGGPPSGQNCLGEPSGSAFAYGVIGCTPSLISDVAERDQLLFEYVPAKGTVVSVKRARGRRREGLRRRALHRLARRQPRPGEEGPPRRLSTSSGASANFKRVPVLALEKSSWELRLANDRDKRPNTEFGVIWHRYRYRRVRQALLHEDVAPSTPDFLEAVFAEDVANLPPRKYSELTQPRPRPA